MQFLLAYFWAQSLEVFGPPDILVNENVGQFPAESFLGSVFTHSAVQSVLFTPTDLGIPSHRPRKYSLVIPEVSKLHGAVAFGVKELTKVAFSKLLLRGSVYLRAPHADIKLYMDHLASTNKMLPSRPENKTYACETVMITGDRMRMLEYRAMLESSGRACDDVIVDVTQNVSFGSVMDVLPTLLRNSMPYSMLSNRLFLATELLAAQGFPVYLEADDEVWRDMPNEVKQCIERLMNQPDLTLRRMLGNTMHLAQVGSVLAIVLASACT